MVEFELGTSRGKMGKIDDEEGNYKCELSYPFQTP